MFLYTLIFGINLLCNDAEGQISSSEPLGISVLFCGMDIPFSGTPFRRPLQTE